MCNTELCARINMGRKVPKSQPGKKLGGKQDRSAKGKPSNKKDQSLRRSLTAEPLPVVHGRRTTENRRSISEGTACEQEKSRTCSAQGGSGMDKTRQPQRASLHATDQSRSNVIDEAAAKPDCDACNSTDASPLRESSDIVEDSVQGLVSLSQRFEMSGPGVQMAPSKPSAVPITKQQTRRSLRLSKGRNVVTVAQAKEVETGSASRSPCQGTQTHGVDRSSNVLEPTPVWSTTESYMRLPPNEASRNHPLPPGMILEPGPNDIVLGRGRSYQFFQGNIKMMAFVERRKDEYNKLQRSKRRSFGHEIVNDLTRSGARFLRKVLVIAVDKGTNKVQQDQQQQQRNQTASDDVDGVFFWEEVSREVAYAKVTHVLRGTRHPRKKTPYKAKSKGNPRSRPLQFKTRQIDVENLQASPHQTSEEPEAKQGGDQTDQTDFKNSHPPNAINFTSTIRQTSQQGGQQQVDNAMLGANNGSDPIAPALQNDVLHLLVQQIQSSSKSGEQHQQQQRQLNIPSMNIQQGTIPVSRDPASPLSTLANTLLSTQSTSSIGIGGPSMTEQFLLTFLSQQHTLTKALSSLAEFVQRLEHNRMEQQLRQQEQRASNQEFIHSLLAALVSDVSSSTLSPPPAATMTGASQASTPLTNLVSSLCTSPAQNGSSFTTTNQTAAHRWSVNASFPSCTPSSHLLPNHIVGNSFASMPSNTHSPPGYGTITEALNHQQCHQSCADPSSVHQILQLLLHARQQQPPPQR